MKRIGILFTNSKSNVARNLGYALLLITPIVMATSCKKDDPEPVTPVTPVIQKHNATVVYNRDENPSTDFASVVGAYKDSLNVDTVFFQVLGDWSPMPVAGGVNQMNNIFYPVFNQPVKVWGKGNLNTNNFSDEAKQFLISKGYQVGM